MNPQDLVRPIRSIPRFRLRPGTRPDAGLLAEILRPGPHRCSANVAVFGGRSPSAENFAAAALACLGPLDSLWRVGAEGPSAGPVYWLPPGDPLIEILNARVVFLPADDQHKLLFDEWHRRADGIFVGPGNPNYYQQKFSEFDPEKMWPWPPVPPAQPPPPFELDDAFIPEKTDPQPAVARAQTSPATRSTAGSKEEFSLTVWSPRREVRGILRGTAGGHLTLTFAALSLALAGARIAFRILAGAAREIRGSVELWPDGSGLGLSASWMGNQLNFERRATPPGAEPEGEGIRLEFSVEPPPAKGG